MSVKRISLGMRMEKMQSFKDLRTWNLGTEITTDVDVPILDFLREEVCGLTSLPHRAAVSASANIAEGFQRYAPTEHKQYLHSARGLLAKLELTVAQRLGLIAVFLKKIK